MLCSTWQYQQQASTYIHSLVQQPVQDISKPDFKFYIRHNIPFWNYFMELHSFVVCMYSAPVCRPCRSVFCDGLMGGGTAALMPYQTIHVSMQHRGTSVYMQSVFITMAPSKMHFPIMAVFLNGGVLSPRGFPTGFCKCWKQTWPPKFWSAVWFKKDAPMQCSARGCQTIAEVSAGMSRNWLGCCLPF